MKNILPLIALFTLVACKKEVEITSNNNVSDSLFSSTDSASVSTIQNPDHPAAFEIAPLDEAAAKGKSIFTLNGNTIFYIEQNANKGMIRIDGKDYPLNKFDFNEDNYTLSGDQVKIEATDGDFKEQTSDCLYGVFPSVKVTMGDKVVNLANVHLQDCPEY